MFETTNIVEKNICLLSVIPSGPINLKASEQLIKTHKKPVGPDCLVSGGALYGQDNKLDTSSWAKYTLAVLSRICRPLSITTRKVRETFGNLNVIDGVHI